MFIVRWLDSCDVHAGLISCVLGEGIANNGMLLASLSEYCEAWQIIVGLNAQFIIGIGIIQ